MLALSTRHMNGHRRFRLLAVVLFLLAELPTQRATGAESDWAQCGGGLVLPARPVFEIANLDPEATHLAADDAEIQRGGLSVLSGNVEVQRGTRQLTARRLQYDEAGGLLELEGGVQVWDEGAYLSGESARHEVETDTTTVRGASYMFLDSHSRGSAGAAELTSDDVVTINDADYTTCNPDSNAWLLRADRLRLDYPEDTGEAWNVWLRVKDVPVFYTPYANFPLSDKRKSGFLIPTFRQSSSTGFEVTVPYYFNIAPNQDATVALRPMTRRGVQMQGEYRLLTRGGEGLIAGEYLPYDSEFGDDRSAVRFRQDGNPSPGWRTRFDVNWVSDPFYFDDLGTNLAVASRTFLERLAELEYTGRGWTGLARAQSFQTLDVTLAEIDRPYERLPQLVFASNLRSRNYALNPGGHLEYVNFTKDVGVIGSRIDVLPTLDFPMRSAAWFAVPSANVRLTQYNLDRTAPTASQSPSRAVPTFSFDTGAVFERDWEAGGRPFLQTLEPRLFYLYVPYRDQDDLPIFDTGAFDFSFLQLFRDNRFSGPDRIGDANQLSVALTSRLLASGSGEELARFNLGQIRYFRDREVTLPGEPVQTSRGSPVVAELSALIARRWTFAGGIQVNPDGWVNEKSSAALRYQPDPRRVVNLAYRFDRVNFEQTDVSVAWPLGRDWRLVGRWNYALDSGVTLEAFGGVEYESCCWAFRTVLRRYVSGVGARETNSIFLQLEFKGLTGVGRSTVDFLERSIPGYENEF